MKRQLMCKLNFAGCVSQILPEEGFGASTAMQACELVHAINELIAGLTVAQERRNHLYITYEENGR